jgi:dCMP deaminase
MNVIYNATFNGVSLDGASLYVYGLPVCSECAKGIIQVGIKKVIIQSGPIEEVPQIWIDSWRITSEMFDEAKVIAWWKE